MGAKEYKIPFTIIFSIGVNDSQFIHSRNSIKTSENEFRNNIDKLIELAKKFTSKIIFVGLTPVDESKTTPIPWDTNKSYRNDYIKKYDRIIQSTCKKNKLDFVEIFDELIKRDYKKLIEDGLHPNSKGHQKIFEIVKDFLIKERII